MKRAALLAALSVASLAFAPAAGAAVGSTGQTGPSKVVNPGDPGTSQYQEDVPSAFGSVPATNLSAHARHARAPSVPSVVLPHSVASALANNGSAGRAAAALAVAGTPTVEPTRAAPVRHHRASGRRSPHHARTVGHRHVVTPAPSATPTAHLVAGPGRSVTASVARSVFGSDGGLGDLLPILLVMSALFGTGVAVGRRRGRSR